MLNSAGTDAQFVRSRCAISCGILRRSEDIAVYEDIKRRSDKVVYVSREYTPNCMHRRNRHLVDHSGTCICYLTRDSGGTAYTVDYARREGLHVINIARSI